MTALESRLVGYLGVRRAMGYKLARAEKLLAQFIAWMGYSQDRAEKSIRRLPTRKLRLRDGGVRLRRDSLAA